MGDHEGENRADERGRNCVENLERDPYRWIQERQHQKEAGQRTPRQNRNQVRGGALCLELPAEFDEIPGRDRHLRPAGRLAMDPEANAINPSLS